MQPLQGFKRKAEAYKHHLMENNHIIVLISVEFSLAKMKSIYPHLDFNFKTTLKSS